MIEPRSSHRAIFWPLVSAGVLIAVVTTWLAFRIQQVILTYSDELLTAERSREMLLLGRDIVHFNFRASFWESGVRW